MNSPAPQLERLPSQEPIGEQSPGQQPRLYLVPDLVEPSIEAEATQLDPTVSTEHVTLGFDVIRSVLKTAQAKTQPAQTAQTGSIYSMMMERPRMGTGRSRRMREMLEKQRKKLEEELEESSDSSGKKAKTKRR